MGSADARRLETEREVCIFSPTTHNHSDIRNKSWLEDNNEQREGRARRKGHCQNREVQDGANASEAKDGL
jgi:hypothetical protein